MKNGHYTKVENKLSQGIIHSTPRQMYILMYNESTGARLQYWDIAYGMNDNNGSTIFSISSTNVGKFSTSTTLPHKA